MDTLTRTPQQPQTEATNASPAEATPGQEQPSAATEERLKIQNKAKSGASWFFWIAALSLLNSIMTMAGADWAFIVGLGITQFFDALGAELGASGVTFALSVLSAGTFAMFGVFAHKRHSWSYVVGMVLYALDGMLFLIVGDMLGAGFHVLVLFWMFQGYRAHKALAAQPA